MKPSCLRLMEEGLYNIDRPSNLILKDIVIVLLYLAKEIEKNPRPIQRTITWDSKKLLPRSEKSLVKD